ncbi:MAG TPA: hypothetical protein VGL91_24195 [Acidobacteriota bacterium]
MPTLIRSTLLQDKNLHVVLEFQEFGLSTAAARVSSLQAKEA